MKALRRPETRPPAAKASSGDYIWKTFSLFAFRTLEDAHFATGFSWHRLAALEARKNPDLRAAIEDWLDG